MNVMDYEYLDENDLKELAMQEESEKEESIKMEEACDKLYIELNKHYNNYNAKTYKFLENENMKNSIIEKIYMDYNYDEKILEYLKNKYSSINRNVHNYNVELNKKLRENIREGNSKSVRTNYLPSNKKTNIFYKYIKKIVKKIGKWF